MFKLFADVVKGASGEKKLSGQREKALMLIKLLKLLLRAWPMMCFVR